MVKKTCRLKFLQGLASRGFLCCLFFSLPLSASPLKIYTAKVYEMSNYFWQKDKEFYIYSLEYSLFALQQLRNSCIKKNIRQTLVTFLVKKTIVHPSTLYALYKLIFNMLKANAQMLISYIKWKQVLTYTKNYTYMMTASWGHLISN